MHGGYLMRDLKLTRLLRWDDPTVKTIGGFPNRGEDA
jgi:hypothetical protein